MEIPKQSIESASKFHFGDALSGPKFGPEVDINSPRFAEGLGRTLQLAEGDNVLKNEDGEALEVASVNVLDSQSGLNRIIATATDGWVYEIDYNPKTGIGRIEGVHQSQDKYNENIDQRDAAFEKAA